VKYRIFSRTNEPVSGDSNISVFTVDEYEDREPNDEMSDASSFCEEVEVLFFNNLSSKWISSDFYEKI